MPQSNPFMKQTHRHGEQTRGCNGVGAEEQGEWDQQMRATIDMKTTKLPYGAGKCIQYCETNHNGNECEGEYMHN